jgi:hypothetical protein
VGTGGGRLDVGLALKLRERGMPCLSEYWYLWPSCGIWSCPPSSTVPRPALRFMLAQNGIYHTYMEFIPGWAIAAANMQVAGYSRVPVGPSSSLNQELSTGANRRGGACLKRRANFVSETGHSLRGVPELGGLPFCLRAGERGRIVSRHSQQGTVSCGHGE